MPQAARIFVSHASEDSAWCDKFVIALRSSGADAWYDEHNLGYGGLMDVIEREIRDRSIFIVVLSPHAVASRWVQREMQAAIILQDDQPERIIIPVQAEKSDIPVFWRTYKYLSGPGNTSLAASEAAGRVAHTLALVPASAAAAPVPAAPSETAEQAWERGKGLRAQGRHQEALAAFERAVSLAPGDARFWHDEAYTLDDLDRYAEALIAYDRALAIDAKRATFWYNKGVTLRKLKRHDEAVAAYERALTLDPKYTLAWNGKGVALWYLRRFEEAQAAYEQALAVDPKFTVAWYNKGKALRDLKRYDEALAASERALTLDPKYTLAWNDKIDLLDKLGRKAEANEARRQRDAALKGS